MSWRWKTLHVMWRISSWPTGSTGIRTQGAEHGRGSSKKPMAKGFTKHKDLCQFFFHDTWWGGYHGENERNLWGRLENMLSVRCLLITLEKLVKIFAWTWMHFNHLLPRLEPNLLGSQVYICFHAGWYPPGKWSTNGGVTFTAPWAGC